MKKFKHILGFLWCLPVSIVGWLLLLILFMARQVSDVFCRSDLTFVCNFDRGGWFFRKMFMERGYVGFSMGNLIMVSDEDHDRIVRTIRHEEMHCYQQYKFGVLFYPVYGIISFVLYLLKGDLHPYYDNMFEIQARKHAGQQVRIPKSEWQKSSKDRFIWR